MYFEINSTFKFMKKRLFGTYSLIALSIPATLLTLAPNAQAIGRVLGSTATTNMGTFTSGSPLSNLTNQSGLSATYTSGTTDFDIPRTVIICVF
jgi:hypothetical protein